MVRINDRCDRPPSMSQHGKACLAGEGRQTTVLKKQHRQLFKPLRTVLIHANSVAMTTRVEQNKAANSCLSL
jgi:hypothetical protein